MNEKYQSYVPTKWEKRIDALFGLMSTKVAMNRMVNRERMNWFRYLSAQPTSSRRNAPFTTAGEWLKVQREKLQIMWNAIMMVDNSGLCTGILIKFPTYVCGTLNWQARTGDKGVNDQYEAYIKMKCGKPGNIDITRRYTLRQMCMLDIKSIALKGDVGTNIVRQDDEIYLQGIEADRIGDPYKWVTDAHYVRGLELDDYGAITGVRVFHQDRLSGYYKYDDTYPTRTPKGLPNFLFFTNPIDYDNYRGVSLFQHAIDNSTYIDRMRQYELQALLWAASQSGVYYTKSGGLPEALPFSRQPIIDGDGNKIDVYEARPNTISALSSDGERVEMFQHDRPSPNVIGMYENTIQDIAVGTGLTKPFVWSMTGLTGPAVRQASAQDARAIQIWQEMLREQKLDPVVMLLLGDAIAKGELPYHKNWLKWEWFFPAKPTIDVGRESQADIEELEACINTGANIAALGGRGDIGEVIEQRSKEIHMMILACQDVGKQIGIPWDQVYALMVPPPRGRGTGGGMVGASKVAGMVSGDGERGATSDGVSLNGDGEDGDGKSRFRLKKNERGSCYELVTPSGDIIEFDAESGKTQERDQSGRFADEGKASTEPGYKHPGEDGAVKEAPAKASISVDNIDQHRGEVRSDELRKVKDNIDGAFNRTADTRIVPTHSLVSNKDERQDLKYVAGEKPDPRQRASDKMVAAINAGGAKRDPIEVHDNMDGTYTIKDGNATAQAAMLAGWTKLPVKITSESPEPEMSAIEKALVDYKPGERPLTGPGTERIQDVLHNSRFVPYDRTRFFQPVNRMMDVADPTKVTGEQYKKLRDDFFNKMPVQQVPIDQVVATQRRVNTAKVDAIANREKQGTVYDPIQVVRYKGETYILNGHHRAVMYANRGDKTIRAHVLDLGDSDPSNAEIRTYHDAALAKPKFDKMLTDIAEQNKAKVVTSPLKQLGSLGGARDKVNAKGEDGYDGDWSKIKDVLRGRILTTDETGMKAVSDYIVQKYGLTPKAPPPGGYHGFRDIKFNPVVDGVTTEISITTDKINEVAMSPTNHELYKNAQALVRNVRNQGRKPTKAELDTYNGYVNQMKSAFVAAVA